MVSKCATACGPCFQKAAYDAQNPRFTSSLCPDDVAQKNEPAKYHSRFYRISAWGDGLRLLLLLLPQRPALGRGHCWDICAALQLLPLARSVRCLLLTLQSLIALEYFSQLDALFGTQHLQDARLP